MEAKKLKKADLSRFYGMLFNFGLVVSLLTIIVAFEWKFYDQGALVDLGQVSDNFEDVMEIPPTEILPPPPPKVQQPEIIEIPNDEEVEEQIEIDLDVAINDETIVEDVVFIDDEPAEEVTDEPFLFVEESAAPEGGMSAFYDYLRKNLRYPNPARRMGIDGTVYLTFIVERDGSLTDVTVQKGIGAGCDEEAIRVLEKAPNWKPGKQRGKKVRQRMQMPIRFTLN
jgi:protein TonB